MGQIDHFCNMNLVNGEHSTNEQPIEREEMDTGRKLTVCYIGVVCKTNKKDVVRYDCCKEMK